MDGGRVNSSPLFDTYPAPVTFANGTLVSGKARTIVTQPDESRIIVIQANPDGTHETVLDATYLEWLHASRTATLVEGQTISVGPTVGCGCGDTLKNISPFELVS